MKARMTLWDRIRRRCLERSLREFDDLGRDVVTPSTRDVEAGGESPPLLAALEPDEGIPLTAWDSSYDMEEHERRQGSNRVL